MGRVSIEQQQKKKDRVSVYIDGEFVCGLDSFTALRCGVKDGAEMEREELVRIHTLSERQTATDKAMAYASAKMHSEKQMVRYLTDKGYAKELVDDIINKLKEYGYIDDKKLATTYVDYYKNSRGKNKIKFDLAKMEISKDVIDEALEDFESQEDLCMQVALKYAKTHNPIDRNKLCAHLYGKGFSMSEIYHVADKVAKGEEEW